MIWVTIEELNGLVYLVTGDPKLLTLKCDIDMYKHCAVLIQVKRF